MLLMSGVSHKVVACLKPLNVLSYLLKQNSFIRCLHNWLKFVNSASTSSIISLTDAISALALFNPLCARLLVIIILERILSHLFRIASVSQPMTA